MDEREGKEQNTSDWGTEEKKEEIIDLLKSADNRRLNLIYQYIKALMA